MILKYHYKYIKNFTKENVVNCIAIIIIIHLPSKCSSHHSYFSRSITHLK